MDDISITYLNDKLARKSAKLQAAYNRIDQLEVESASLRGQLKEWLSANGPAGWVDELREDKARLDWLEDYVRAYEPEITAGISASGERSISFDNEIWFPSLRTAIDAKKSENNTNPQKS